MNLAPELLAEIDRFVASHQAHGDKSAIILLTGRRGLHGHKFTHNGVTITWKFTRIIPVFDDGSSRIYITTKRYWKQQREQAQRYASRLRGTHY